MKYATKNWFITSRRQKPLTFFQEIFSKASLLQSAPKKNARCFSPRGCSLRLVHPEVQNSDDLAGLGIGVGRFSSWISVKHLISFWWFKFNMFNHHQPPTKTSHHQKSSHLALSTTLSWASADLLVAASAMANLGVRERSSRSSGLIGSMSKENYSSPFLLAPKMAPTWVLHLWFLHLWSSDLRERLWFLKTLWNNNAHAWCNSWKDPLNYSNPIKPITLHWGANSQRRGNPRGACYTQVMGKLVEAAVSGSWCWVVDASRFALLVKPFKSNVLMVVN